MEAPISPRIVRDNLIPFYSSFYNVSESLMSKIVLCESSYRNTAQHFNPGIEDSVGVAQINLLAHPSITRYQAMNSFFSLTFLAQHLAKGETSLWNGSKKCWNTS